MHTKIIFGLTLSLGTDLYFRSGGLKYGMGWGFNSDQILFCRKKTHFFRSRSDGISL